MVNNIRIERECEHKIIVKQDLFLVITLTEFITDLNDFNSNEKYASINVSLINNNSGAQISKIGGHGATGEIAYKNCINNFNENINFHTKENEILLCCRQIPKLEYKDLQEFRLTRIIKFSWKKNDEINKLTAYLQKEENSFIFTFDGTEECYRVKTEKEIIEYILLHYNFDSSPEETNIKRRGRLFYPTIKEFLR